VAAAGYRVVCPDLVGFGRSDKPAAIADHTYARHVEWMRALAFDVATGREVVNTEVFRVDRPEELNAKNSYASPTPIVDGDRVYVHFGAQGTCGA
jgi:hypothetical protein